MVRIPKPALLRRRLLNYRKRRVRNVWSQDEISKVMAHYDLKLRKVGDFLGGGNSDNVLLQTYQGKKILKRYYWSIDSTVYEHSIHNYLANKDFPSARLSINRSDATITISDKRLYAVYDFIEGYSYSEYFCPPKIKRSFIAQAGEKLANYHQLIVGFIPEGKKLNGFKPHSNKLWRATAWHLNVIDQYREKVLDKSISDKRVRFFSRIADKLKHEYEEADRLYEKADHQLPKLVIHSDYKPNNVLYNNQKISGILDFGDANLNFRVADVARGLSTFCSRKRSIINQYDAKIFLNNYLSVQKLTQEEMASIPTLLRRGCLRHIIWSLHGVMKSHLNRKSREKHFNLIRSNWERASLIKGKTPELRSALLSILCVKS